jgi:hypothetical protein
MRNLCFTVRPLQFSKIAHKPLGSSFSLLCSSFIWSIFLPTGSTAPSLSPLSLLLHPVRHRGAEAGSARAGARQAGLAQTRGCRRTRSACGRHAGARRWLWQNQPELYRLKYASPLSRAPTCFKRYNPLACRVTSR